MSILIAGGEPDSRMLIEKILKTAGYIDVFNAESAAALFQILDRSNAPLVPSLDLVIMDIILPDMDGVAACLLIKKREHWRDISVIIIDNDYNIDTLQAAFSAGAIDYMTKPLNAVELTARVKSALTHKRETDRRKAREKELLEVTCQLEEAIQSLRTLSFLDGLTGIANRRRFDEVFLSEWNRALRDSHPLSLIILDIDFFKNYNDTYGHQVGDDCLRKVAGSMGGVLKRPADLVARYGGEEFAVILPNTDMQGAVLIAEMLRAGVEALQIPHASSPVSKYITVSAGVSSAIPMRAYSPRNLLKAADKALYLAKHDGRNKVIMLEICNDDE